MEPADGRVGSGPLQGMAADSQETSHISWGTHCLCTFKPPQIHVCIMLEEGYTSVSLYVICVSSSWLCWRFWWRSEGIHNWAGLFLLWYLNDNSWQNGITVKWDKLKLILSFELFRWFLAFWPIPLKMGVYVMLSAPPVWIILLSPTVSFMILPLGDVKVRNVTILHIHWGFKCDFFTERFC